MSLDGGKYVGDDKLCGRVFCESRRISFVIPDSIIIEG